MSKRSGLTLVELLIAVSLSIVIVGIVASTSIQAQNAMHYADVRQSENVHARALFTDIERDLSHMLATSPLPAPFDKDTPLQIGKTNFTDPSTDSTLSGGSFKRFADRLRIVTVNDEGDRMLVEYCLDPGSKSTTFTDSNSGGFWTANLRRHVLKLLPAGSAPTAVVAEPDPRSAMIELERVISFQLCFRLPGDSSIYKSDGDPGSDDGTLFALEGDYTIDKNSDDLIVPSTTTDQNMLKRVAVGLPINLYIRGPNNVPNAYTVRSKVANGASGVYLNNRVALDPSAKQPVHGRAVVPPTILAAIVVVAVGKGPSGDTARYTRQIPVSR
jgi:hypothetical protein